MKYIRGRNISKHLSDTGYKIQGDQEYRELLFQNKYENLVYVENQVIMVERILNNDTLDLQVFIIPIRLLDTNLEDSDAISSFLLERSKCIKYELSNWSYTPIRIEEVVAYSVDDGDMYRMKGKPVAELENDTILTKATKCILNNSKDLIVDEPTKKLLANVSKQVMSNSISYKKLEEVANTMGVTFGVYLEINNETYKFH